MNPIRFLVIYHKRSAAKYTIYKIYQTSHFPFLHFSLSLTLSVFSFFPIFLLLSFNYYFLSLLFLSFFSSSSSSSSFAAFDSPCGLLCKGLWRVPFWSIVIPFIYWYIYFIFFILFCICILTFLGEDSRHAVMHKV